MAIDILDIPPISYDDVQAGSSTANSITLTIAADTVSTTINNYQVLINITTYWNNFYVDFSTIFTELANDWTIFYVKDNSINIPVKVEKWDSANNKARLWVTIPVMTTAAKDIVLEFDNTETVKNPLLKHMYIIGMLKTTLQSISFNLLPNNNDPVSLDKKTDGGYRLNIGQTEYTVSADVATPIETCFPPNYAYRSHDLATSVEHIPWFNEYTTDAYRTGLNDCISDQDIDDFGQIISDQSGALNLYSTPNGFQPTSLWGKGIIGVACAGAGNTIYVGRSIDGISWTFYQVGGVANDTRLILLTNQNDAVGGFFTQRTQGDIGNEEVYTSNITGDVFTYRGEWTRPTGLGGDVNGLYPSMFYGDDTVNSFSIVKYLLDVTPWETYYWGVFDNYGTTLLHNITMPTVTGWGEPGTPMGIFAYDGTTLFGLFQDQSQNTGWGTVVGALFKSTDKGLTWGLVSDLQPDGYGEQLFLSRHYNEYDDTQSASHLMRINNGYLNILLGVNSSSMVGDNCAFFQFKI